MMHFVISMDHSLYQLPLQPEGKQSLSFTYCLPYTVIIRRVIFLWYLSSLKVKTIKNNAASQLCFKTSKLNGEIFISWPNSLK